MLLNKVLHILHIQILFQQRCKALSGAHVIDVLQNCVNFSYFKILNNKRIFKVISSSILTILCESVEES